MNKAGKYGRVIVPPDWESPRFSAFLAPNLAQPPVSYSVLDRVVSQIGTNNIAKLFPMDYNDAYGDCTVAAAAHAQTCYRALAGSLAIFGAKDVLHLYLKLTSGVDSGLPETTVLQYWHKYPINNDRILGSAHVDPRNHDNVKQAIFLFGGVYTCCQVTREMIPQFEAGQPWAPGSLLPEGHAIYTVAYDETGVSLLTWGGLQKASWAWWDQCVQTASAIVPPEANSQKFAQGFNSQDLLTALKTLQF